MEPIGMLIDFTECIGCQECEEACRQQNDLPENPSETDLSARNYTVVLRHEPSGIYYRKLCMHCLVPSCVSACPVGALTKSEQGPVLYDAGKCMGCRYCMIACPFGVPRYQWDKAVPLVSKCTFCSERVAAGGETACSWVCPMGATRMGERRHLLEIARDRIRRKPDRYYPHIYGETEAGGTSVLMLSSVPFKDLGFPTGVGVEPLPQLTWQVLSKLPGIVITGGLLLGGVSWVINRRIQLEGQAREAAERKPAPEDEGRGE
ncbi:MAG: 4Fe-4S dicluster domain-containing protein [Candidatus Glassbacteria bacterium]|nr:4Fe-4S dicluster domain-containing protein [Candidatus Glassbacteria bacterium]